MLPHRRSRGHPGDGPGPRTPHERPRPTDPGRSLLAPGGERPPVPGLAEVRIIADHPDTAQLVARVLRRHFTTDEPRSYPTGEDGSGTLLHFTVDTRHDDTASPAPGPWPAGSLTQEGRLHDDEPG